MTICTSAILQRLGRLASEQRVVIQGYGKVGAPLVKLLGERGMKVVGIADIEGAIHVPEGINHLTMTEHFNEAGTVVGYPPLVDDPHTYPVFQPVPEEHGTAVVDLGPSPKGIRTILMSADAPRTAELYAARGLDVVTVPITEFEKLEGCVTCLSVRIRRTEADEEAP